MIFAEYLIPTLVLITTAYSAISFYFFKNSKENVVKINQIGDAVKETSIETSKKVGELSKNFDESISPSLKSLELEIKNINCHFSSELVLEKLKSNGYKKAKLLSNNKIITGVITEIEGGHEKDELRVSHIIALELENSSILIESYSLALKEPDTKVYEEILKINSRLKVSDFGIKTFNNTVFLIAQSYLVFPKESFHITPLIEALDHLEFAQITLKNKLMILETDYKNISLSDYAEQRIEHDKAIIKTNN